MLQSTQSPCLRQRLQRSVLSPYALQVKGLQTEYQRLLDSGGGYDGAARAGEAGKLREQLEEARALEPQLKEARDAQAAAERNLQARPWLIHLLLTSHL